MKRLAELAATLLEVCRVLQVLSRVEAARQRHGPQALLARLRRQAHGAPQRHSRTCLRRAIRWVDARVAGGGNCYRRALLEMALDRGAAAEPMLLGFDMQDDRLAGHAWLASAERDNSYPITVRL